MAGGARICLGQIGAAHGVRGEVRLYSFTSDPEAIARYGPLETNDGRVFAIEALRPAKDHLVARLAGIRDRDAAEQLAKTRLYVPRERLPEPEEADEFYHADLIGLAVVDRAGASIGRVVAIHNFGAGDLIEVRPDGGRKTELLPFNETCVPLVDVAAGKVVIDPAEGMFSPSPPAGVDDKTKPSHGTAGRSPITPALAGTASSARSPRSTLSRKGRG